VSCRKCRFAILYCALRASTYLPLDFRHTFRHPEAWQRINISHLPGLSSHILPEKVRMPPLAFMSSTQANFLPGPFLLEP